MNQMSDQMGTRQRINLSAAARNVRPDLELSSSSGVRAANRWTTAQLFVGGRIRVDFRPKDLKAIRALHSYTPGCDWYDLMEKYLGRVGCLSRMTETGGVRVSFFDSPPSTRSPFVRCPVSVSREMGCAVGEMVLVFHGCLIQACPDYHFSPDTFAVLLPNVSHLLHLNAALRWTTEQANERAGRIVRVLEVGREKVAVRADGTEVWETNPETLVPVYDEQKTAELEQRPGRFGDPKIQPPLLQELGLPGFSPSSAQVRYYLGAAELGQKHVILEFIARHNDCVDVCLPNGKTALMLSALNGREELVVLLLLANADSSKVCDRKNTVLHYAVMGGNPKVVERILEASERVTARNADGRTALHLAIANEDEDCVGVLLRSPEIQELDIQELMNADGESPKRCCPLCKQDVLSKSEREQGALEAVQKHPLVQELQKKLEDVENQYTCPICFDRKCAVVFQCGHMACQICGTRGDLRNCHICRRRITHRQPFYSTWS